LGSGIQVETGHILAACPEVRRPAAICILKGMLFGSGALVGGAAGMILPAQPACLAFTRPLSKQDSCSGEQRPTDGAMPKVADSLHPIFVVLLFHVGRWNFAGDTTQ
jgi:hypothetical protein